MRIDENKLEIEILTPDNVEGQRFTMRRLINLVGANITGVALLEYNPILSLTGDKDIYYALLLTHPETGQEQVVTFLRDEEANGPGYFDAEYVGYKTANGIRVATKLWKNELGPDPFEFGDIFESDLE